MSATPLALTPEALAAWDKSLERAPSDGGACVLLKRAEVAALIHDAHVARELYDLVNTPELVDFAKAVHLEAVHQEQRWGTADRQGKGPYEWYWLLSHLATRALEHHKEAERMQSLGDAGHPTSIAHHREKAAHHTITAAAMLAHWHASVVGKHTAMQPGHSMSAAGAAHIGVDPAAGKDQTVFWTVGEPIKANTKDLARAVFRADQYPRVFSHELPQVHSFVNLTMRQLALCCLGGRSVELDLGDGHILRCAVEKAPAHGGDR